MANKILLHYVLAENLGLNQLREKCHLIAMCSMYGKNDMW